MSHVSQLGMDHIMGSMSGVGPVPKKKRGRPRKGVEPITGIKDFEELVESKSRERESLESEPFHVFRDPNRIDISDFGKSIELTAQNESLLEVLKREYEKQRAIAEEAKAKMAYLDSLVSQCEGIEFNK